MYLLHHLPTIRSSHNSCNPTKMTNTHGDTLDSDCRKYSQGGLHPSPTAVNYVHGDRPIGSAVTASERTGKHARRCDGSKSPNHGDEGDGGLLPTNSTLIVDHGFLVSRTIDSTYTLISTQTLRVRVHQGVSQPTASSDRSHHVRHPAQLRFLLHLPRHRYILRTPPLTLYHLGRRCQGYRLWSLSIVCR